MQPSIILKFCKSLGEMRCELDFTRIWKKRKEEEAKEVEEEGGEKRMRWAGEQHFQEKMMGSVSGKLNLKHLRDGQAQ